MVTELRPLQKTEEVWVGGRRAAPVLVVEDGGPCRPELALWLDVTNDWVVGSHIETPGEPIADLADALSKAMHHPAAGPPRQPAKIRLADAQTAQHLRRRFGTSIAVEVGPTPELDALVYAMVTSLCEAEGEKAQSYFGDGAITEASLRRFFEAAAALWKTAPWRFLCDAQLLQLNCAALGIEGKAVSILGNLGESYGALIFDDVDGYHAMAERGQRLERGDLQTDLGTSLFAINFERGADISGRMRSEVAQHAWDVADPHAYPVVMRIEPDGLCRPLTDADVQRATLYAQGLAQFFAQHQTALLDGTFSPACAHIDMMQGDKAVRIAVEAPHPQWPWTLDAQEVFEHEDPDMAQSKSMRDAFLRHERQQGREASWLDAADYICEILFEFRLYCADGTLHGWTAPILKAFLLAHVPQHVAISQRDAAHLPEVLRAFFGWAHQTGHLNKRSLNALHRCIARHEDQYAHTVHDPRHFGMVKAVLQTAVAAGIDPKNQQAMGAYLKKMQAGLEPSAPN